MKSKDRKKKTLSIRQSWTWLITHPEILKVCQLPRKDVENWDWTTSYREDLIVHAGTAVDTSLLDPRSGKLEAWYWERTFGKEAGQALIAHMPRHKDDYPRRAIVGQATLTDVVTTSTSPWFHGPYGLVLAQAQTITPISYPGSFKIFDVPATVLRAAAKP